jgi:hypothetical protein
MTDAEFEGLKERTVKAFIGPFETWLRECPLDGRDRKQCFASLAVFFGHALGAAAVHFNFENTPRLAVSTGELVAENMADDIAAQTFEIARER